MAPRTSNSSDGRATIETQRLILRGAKDEDAAGLHQAFRDPEVMRFWSSVPHADPARTRSWVKSMMDSPQNGVTDFVICLKSDSSSNQEVAIGKLGIFAGRPSNEIGFMISRQHWRKGMASEALTAVIGYLFDLQKNTTGPITEGQGRAGEEPGSPGSPVEAYTTLTAEEMQDSWLYPSITADADPRNAASVGILEKIGFLKSGYLERSMQVGEEWVDSQYLRLTREDWAKRKQALS